MAKVSPEAIRNVALVGQAGAGKTLLAESLAYCSGAIKRMGRIEDGSTVSDYEPEEVKHKHSISLSLLSLGHGGMKINVLDTPGVADFIGEVQSGLAAADLCVFVVSAADNVGPDSLRLWEMLEASGIPRMVFVNKLDRERANFFETVETLKTLFGPGIAPLEIPIGTEADFRGVVDLLTDRAFAYSESQTATEVEIPQEISDLEHSVHDQLVEGIVVADDALMERYLGGDIPSPEELERAMALGVNQAIVFPTVCGAASKDMGVDRLIKFICEMGPAPSENSASQDQTVTLQVVKTYADPFLGKLSLAKVLTGTLKPASALTNARTSTDERIGQIFTLMGKEHLPMDSACAGDLVALTKLTSTRTSDQLTNRQVQDSIPPIQFEPSLLQVTVTPHNQKDDDKLYAALLRLAEEDPTLRVERDPRSHKPVLSGHGETHISITLERAARKFGVEASHSEPEIPYLESIASPARAEGRYKKQTGGHGQFGVADISIAPLARGDGFKFHDEIVGGTIPRNFIPAVEKGIIEAMNAGGRFGFPVVDLEVHLTDGKYHPVDSSEMSFKMAGSLAFHEAFNSAQPILLEPIDRLTVVAPVIFQGDILGDLNSKRAKVASTDVDPNTKRATVVATVPRSEIRRYATDLRSLTSGQGRFNIEFSHYEVAPPNIVAKLKPR